MFYVYRQR
jgi:hypothetical protein